MPGQSFRGPLPPLTPQQRELRQRLFDHVNMLAGVIGQRNVYTSGSLESTIAYLSRIWRDQGYEVREQPYPIHNTMVKNLEVEIRGAIRPDEIVIVGAHYDTPLGVPGANDNASGVAAMLEISRLSRQSMPARTLRFVAFVNEEPPFFQTGAMGSLVYASRCKQRHENVLGMIALETIGFYTDAPNSQQYPPPLAMLYPSTGNFIAFVGNLASLRLVQRCVGSFRAHAQFPSEAGVAPECIAGVGWSDHWSFWQQGYPAIMVTDTAPFRYPHYHQPTDTPDKLDYDRTARVVAGLSCVVSDLAKQAE